MADADPRAWAPPDAPARRARTAPNAPSGARPLSWGADGGGIAPQRRIGPTAWPGPASPYAYVPEPQRPTYRETLRVLPRGIWSGAGMACLWFLLSGLLATSVAAYAWVTAIAALVAWLAAALLARYGDRGAAAGVAAVSGAATAIAGLVVELNALHGDWILW